VKFFLPLSPHTPPSLKVRGIDVRFNNTITLYRADQDNQEFNQGVNDAVAFVQRTVSAVYILVLATASA